jgi:NAD(P)-dependent dehydrogenase (short-subunit alcohol dehydrogenase family)
MKISVGNKVVLVTGAASGLGAAVVLADLNEQKCRKLPRVADKGRTTLAVHCGVAAVNPYLQNNSPMLSLRWN